MADWTQDLCETPPPTLSRRTLFAGLGAEILMLNGVQAMLQEGHDGHVVVVIFLRGGMDGLNVVAPYAEDAYYRGRPTVAIASPKDRRSAGRDRLIDLDGFFGLHPKLSPLFPMFEAGELALVHAVGSGDQTRSHFEAMASMERGLNSGSGGAAGWLGRYLANNPTANTSPLRALALGAVMPDSLRGATEAISVPSLDEFRLLVPKGLGREDDVVRLLEREYRAGNDPMAHAGRETLKVLKTLREMTDRKPKPENGAAYPDSDLGQGLRQVAALMRANVGLQIACLDRGGWDTHVAQGGSTGLQANLVDDLGRSLAAFRKDLGSQWSRMTVVAMTEFGRRVNENSGLGTDHGRGSAMFVMGGKVRGGRVVAEWPGLEPAQTEDGDLRVTTDYRQVLAEITERRLRARSVGTVFPGLQYKPLGLLA